MKVSIAICTRNRAKSLERTLDSIAALSVPGDVRWEVLVVDNGSTDQTSSVIRSFKRLLPIRGELEPRPGVSNARNRAVAEASGEYIVWTDDDVLVDPRWLSEYVEAFRQWPSVVFFGGKILPQLEEPVPIWVNESWTIVANVFAHRDFGDLPVPFTLQPRRLPFGANWAILRSELKTHPFDPNLGPGSQVGNGEEIEIIEAILSEGKQGYWIPGAKVVHCIPRARLTLPYVIENFKTYGRHIAYRHRVCGAPRLFGVPRWLWRRVVIRGCLYRYHRLTSPSAIWMEHLFRFATDVGSLEYYRWLNPQYRRKSVVKNSGGG
jgi:glycosyltransferase involved in cell wall biosynthesis